MIKSYPEGSDITIMNTLYLRPHKLDNGKYSKDQLLITYKDNKLGKKKFELIEEPDYEFFQLNDNVPVQDYNEFFALKENVHPVKVPYRNLEKYLYEKNGKLDEYYDNIRNGNAGANQKIHIEDHSIFNSDTDIEDHYRYRFNKLYKNEIYPITKSFLDIEADTINMVGDFPELGECPINAVTYIDLAKNTSYTFLLRNPDNPLIQEFENSLGPDLFKELREFIFDKVGGEKKAHKYGIDKLDFQMIFYDDELKMLHDLFILINQNEPDFLLAWNMAFDIPYIIARLEEYYGCPAKDIMCHNEAPIKVARYYIDERNKNDNAERGDFCTLASKTIYLDQMIHFMSRRKGTNFDNAKLDYIGEEVVNVKKLDYSHITTDLSKLPYLDYKTFVFYNIMDVIVQVCIEAKVGDIDYIFAKAISTNTRYHKVHRQTVFIVNRATNSFYNGGFIIGNNANRFNPKPDKKFPGALVGNPLNNSEYSKVKINGYATNNISGNKLKVEDISLDWLKEALRIKYADKVVNNKLDIRYLSQEDRRIVEGVPINICDNMIDLDFSSLYPSTERQNNMAPNTQIGRIIIDHKVHDKENPFNYEEYVGGGQFIEDFISQNYIEFCQRWLHLAGFQEMIEDIREYFSKVIYLPQLYMYNRNGYLNTVNITDKNVCVKAVTINEDKPMEKVVTMHVKEVDHSKLRDILIEENTRYKFRRA